ncbi:MAG: DEAD/DEAH box helicase [Erysipelotrichaceae bacterium]|nr:DEAD/DEAH box helicase [Erysipelotrichaceae bacterium]
MEINTFNEFNLSLELLRAIEEMGYVSPTKIQQDAIPVILEGHDVLGKSHTGTGKTAAYGLPMIERLVPNYKMPQALILCPTRELVLQVTEELRKFSKYKEGIKCVPIFGGQSIDHQIQLLKKGCSIVIGTPGRILDHLRRKTLKLKAIDIVVLDEADEMLNMGFKEDIESILSQVNGEHQTLLFSATMPQEILDITKNFQKDPIHVEVQQKQKTINTVKQFYFDVHKAKKIDVIQLLMKMYPSPLTMIFCNTKRTVDEVSDQLIACGIRAVSLHGDMKQSVRTKVLEQFKSQNANVLIASDVAARGLDIDHVDVVINYDLPIEQEFYIHRIGRTGRNGKEGIACTLISGSKEKLQLQRLCKYIRHNIEKGELPTADDVKELYLDQIYQQILTTLAQKEDETMMELMFALRSKGLTDNQIIYALLTQQHQLPNYQDLTLEESEVIRKKAFKNGTEKIHLSIGRKDGVAPNHIVAALAEEAMISSSYIGKIELQKFETVVEVAKEYADKVMTSIDGKTINGVFVEAKPYYSRQNFPKKSKIEPPKKKKALPLKNKHARKR